MVEFTAGTVMGMLAIILGSQLWMARHVVTDEDLETRLDNHLERWH
jgi:hypothetical protein